ncbi:hypothetical protein ES703_115676 [subsurface metagenome]
MPGVLRLNNEEAKALANEIERQGGNADGLRTATRLILPIRWRMRNISGGSAVSPLLRGVKTLSA